MNTQLAVVDHGKDLAVTQDQVTIARNTVASGLNDDQFAVYLYNCQRQGVHPLDGLIVPIIRKEDGRDKLTFVTTVDLLRSRAAETDDYAGSDDPVFEYATDNQNNMKPVAATVTIWKFVHGEKCSFTATARYDEYFPGERQGFMWKSKPHVMLGKCAEGLALRKAFPKQLAGLYLEEELQKENKPAARTSKPAEKPVGNVKCSQCNAIGGHLPHCPTKKQGTTPAPAEQASPKESVMCGDCGQVDGHTSECKYAGKDVPDDGFTETVVAINTIDSKTTKPGKDGKTKPYLILEVTDRENLTWKMYVWHGSIHQYLKPKQMMICRFSTRKDGDKTFCSLEKILELAGVPFVDNKPVVETGEDF